MQVTQKSGCRWHVKCNHFYGEFWPCGFSAALRSARCSLAVAQYRYLTALRLPSEHLLLERAAPYQAFSYLRHSKLRLKKFSDNIIENPKPLVRLYQRSSACRQTPCRYRIKMLFCSKDSVTRSLSRLSIRGPKANSSLRDNQEYPLLGWRMRWWAWSMLWCAAVLLPSLQSF